MDGRAVGVGVGVGVGALLAWWAWRRRNQLDTPIKWEEVGEVSQLVIYPLKSARGVKVTEAEATSYGLACDLLEDRSFLTVTKEGKFITGRQAPKLTTVVVTLEGNKVTLRKVGMEDLEFDLEGVTKAGKVTDSVVFNADVKGFDCGDKAAEWLSEAIYSKKEKEGEDKDKDKEEAGSGVRLLYNGDLTRARKAREAPFFSFPQYKDSDRVIYADTCAFMLTTEASLEDLNPRLPRPVTLDWFRSNIVVRGVEKAYDEDDWAYVKIGDVVFRRLKPCDRCQFTFVDPETGEKCADQEPLATLKKYRRAEGPETLQRTWALKPPFGTHLGIDTCGRLRVGDKVAVARASLNPRWQY